MSTSQEPEKVSAPTTPGQAEGSDNIDEQSQSTPAPTTSGTAEGGETDTLKNVQETSSDQSTP